LSVIVVVAAGEAKGCSRRDLTGLQELRHALSGNPEDRGYIAAGKTCLLQVAGDLSRAGRRDAAE
jgi:hypothetical protein